MGEVLSVNIIWIIKNDRPNRPLSWPSLCLPSDAGEMLIAVNHRSAEDWGTRAAVNPDPHCWSEIDNNLEIPAEFQQACGTFPKRATSSVCFSLSAWVGNSERLPKRTSIFSAVFLIYKLLTYSCLAISNSDRSILTLTKWHTSPVIGPIIQLLKESSKATLKNWNRSGIGLFYDLHPYFFHTPKQIKTSIRWLATAF